MTEIDAAQWQRHVTHIQADAKSTYDFLFRPPDGGGRHDQGSGRARSVFDLDRSWRDRPPAEIKAERERHLCSHTDAIFTWVATSSRMIPDSQFALAERRLHALVQLVQIPAVSAVDQHTMRPAVAPLARRPVGRP